MEIFSIPVTPMMQVNSGTFSIRENSWVCTLDNIPICILFTSLQYYYLTSTFLRWKKFLLKIQSKIPATPSKLQIMGMIRVIGKLIVSAQASPDSLTSLMTHYPCGCEYFGP